MTEFLDFLEIPEDSRSSGYMFSEVLAAGRSSGEQTMVSCWSLRLMPVIFDGQALLKQHGLGASSPPFLPLYPLEGERKRSSKICRCFFSKINNHTENRYMD